MRPERISILGVGLLGGSIGLAVRDKLNSCHVIGYAHRISTLESALKKGVADAVFDDPKAAVAGSELIILCTPVGTLGSLLEKIRPALRPGMIVTDVGSTKRTIVEQGTKLLPPGVHFVGSHPIAGSEKRGVEFARADLFENALCLMTPTDQTDPVALESVEAFWQLLGMKTRRLTPENHDRLLAEISHLPHALAAALVNLVSPEALGLAGKGFADLTRIASGDAGLWRDILQDNRDSVRSSIARLQSELTRVDGMLSSNDGDAIFKWLEAAANRRDEFTSRRVRPADHST